MTVLKTSKSSNRFASSRRRFLRGAGGALLALPILDVLLNDNGDAFAQGQPLPKRFGVWFWGNGVILPRWNPSTTGAGWQLSEALAPLSPVKDYLNVVSNYEVHAAGPRGHHGGESGMLSGVEFIELAHPDSNYSSKFGGPSIDQILTSDLHPDKPAIVLGVSKRIVTSEGPTLQFISHRGPENPIAPEYSPAALYQRLFGGFTPPDVTDPRAQLRASVLDAVAEDARALSRTLGAADRSRLDAHLTAIGELRARIVALPPVLTGICQLPDNPTADTNNDVGGEERLRDVNDIMSDILVLAFACDVARSSSVMFTGSVGYTVFHDVGATSGHHDLTHDGSAASQDMVHQTTVYTMARFNDLLVKLKNTPEGAGNLLDQSLFLATSDLAEGLSHSNADYPIVLAGKAGGAMRFPGVHHRGGTVLGLRKDTNDVLVTILRAMGSARTSIGTGLTRSDTPVTEVLA